MIELVDLRYGPEVNTIVAFAESDRSDHAPPRRTHIWTTTPEEYGLGPDDLRSRPEVNTIGALAELDQSGHAPLEKPIWTTTPEYGLGVGLLHGFNNNPIVFSAELVCPEPLVLPFPTLAFSHCSIFVFNKLPFVDILTLCYLPRG